MPVQFESPICDIHEQCGKYGTETLKTKDMELKLTPPVDRRSTRDINPGHKYNLLPRH